MKTSTTDALLMTLINESITYAESENPRKANKAYDKAAKAYEGLKAQGARDRILELLDFGHPGVRLMAACFALRFAPERGEPVLRELAEGPPGSLRASAGSALRTLHNHPEMIPAG